MEGELIRASSFLEALALKDQDSAFFAGGTGIGYKDSGIHAKRLILVPDYDGIRAVTARDGLVRIGALVTFTQALEESLVPAYLKEALFFCGSLQKRNRATIGGNIASWRSDSYLVPTLIASGALISVADKGGEETIGIDLFARERNRYEDALITAVWVKPDCKEGAADGVSVLSKRFANTVESHAYLTIAMGRKKDEYRIGLAIKKSGIFCPDIRSWDVSWKMANVTDDIYGSEEYKRYLTGVTLESMYEKLGTEGGIKS